MTARETLMTLLGRQVTVTNPAHPVSWSGRLLAVADDPSILIEGEDGGRMCLPQAFVVEPADGEAPRGVRGAANPADQAFPASAEEAPPGSALRDTIAEAVHATSVCEVGDPVRCGGGCRDAADAVLATPELAQRLAHLADYENRITWETNCGEHARLLDSCYAETVRAEKAEAELRRVSALHADTERRLTDDLAAEVRKREAAEATARTLGADTERRLTADVAATVQRAERTSADALRARLDEALAAVARVREFAARLDDDGGPGLHEAGRDLIDLLDTPKETP